MKDVETKRCDQIAGALEVFCEKERCGCPDAVRRSVVVVTLAGQQSLCQRTVGDDDVIVRLGERQQVVLDQTGDQAVADLVAPYPRLPSASSAARQHSTEPLLRPTSSAPRCHKCRCAGSIGPRPGCSRERRRAGVADRGVMAPSQSRVVQCSPPTTTSSQQSGGTGGGTRWSISVPPRRCWRQLVQAA